MQRMQLHDTHTHTHTWEIFGNSMQVKIFSCYKLRFCDLELCNSEVTTGHFLRSLRQIRTCSISLASSTSSSSRNEYYLGGIIALLLQDHHPMSIKSVCSSQYMVTDQHWATGTQIKYNTLSDHIRKQRPEQLCDTQLWTLRYAIFLDCIVHIACVSLA